MQKAHYIEWTQKIRGFFYQKEDRPSQWHTDQYKLFNPSSPKQFGQFLNPFSIHTEAETSKVYDNGTVFPQYSSLFYESF
jgi:hypothetical protein